MSGTLSQTTTHRTLQILMDLVDNELGFTAKELGETYGCADKTIRDSFRTLKEIGISLEKDYQHRYRLVQKERAEDIKQLLLPFSDNELTLYELLNKIGEDKEVQNQLKTGPFAILNPQQLIESLLPKEKRVHINTIYKAIQNQTKVVLKNYKSNHSRTISDREVEPYRFIDNHNQILCYDLASKESKIFKISRIEHVESCQTPWEYEDRHRDLHMDIFHVYQFATNPVKVTMTLRAKNLLCEEYPLAKKDLMDLDQDTFSLETKVCGFGPIGRFILGLPGEILSIESDDLLQHLQRKINKNPW